MSVTPSTERTNRDSVVPRRAGISTWQTWRSRYSAALTSITQGRFRDYMTHYGDSSPGAANFLAFVQTELIKIVDEGLLKIGYREGSGKCRFSMLERGA